MLTGGAMLGDLAEPGGADQPAVCPRVGVDLPDPGVRVGLAPAFGDRVDRDLGGTPAICLEMIISRGGGEQQQRLAEGVELELLVDPVAGDVRAARITRQLELMLVGYRAAGGGVGRLEVG